jgi:hypothetical protein
VLKPDDIRKVAVALENLSIKDIEATYGRHDPDYLDGKLRVINKFGAAYWVCTLDSASLKRLAEYVNSFEI